MISDNFNRQAMEEKIKKNISLGFSLQDILRFLMAEEDRTLKEILIKEARIVELSDQIEYIKQEYNIPSAKG